MKRFLIVLRFISFGITYIIRKLVKKNLIKDQYHFDIDKDGKVDATITFHGDSESSEDNDREEV